MVIAFVSLVYSFDAFSYRVSGRLQLCGELGVTAMAERPNELLARSLWLVVLQFGRESLPAVEGGEWMHSPIF